MTSHELASEDAMSEFPRGQVQVEATRKLKRGRDDGAQALSAETSCDSSVYGISAENSVLSEQNGEQPAARQTPQKPANIIRVTKKKTRIQPQLITGVKVLEDGTTAPLTAIPVQQAPGVNVLSAKKKSRDRPEEAATVVDSGVFSMTAPPPRPARVELHKGLEFTEELIQRLGALQI
eukprot:TRINITY_DN5252_c0_g1_i1.p2 TRINITY_DN5252_c0_g1~~TRINITY_DN5252_c0_g1_i1.p2  ORF type:complete len:178 (+),score=39.69 TRINITY_DN5252_c0_g1_i1:210-743(+)